MPVSPGPRDFGSAGHLALEKRTGGFTEVAADISAFTGLQVSRQCVSQWYSRRGKNGFPDAVRMPWRGTMTRNEFSFSEVRDWWQSTYCHRSRLTE